MEGQTVSAHEFTGTFEHSLDAKNRVSLPSKFRQYLPSDLKVSLSLDRSCLYVFTYDAYRQWVEDVFDGCSRSDRELSRKFQSLDRFIHAFTFDATIDTAGRIGLETKIRELAGIGRDVTILGHGDRIEIHDRAKFNAWENESLDMDFMTE